MQVLIKGKQDNKSLADYFSVSGLNLIMYLIIFVILFAVVYLVSLNYMVYKGMLTNRLTVQITNNDVQQFQDGVYPILSVKVTSRLGSKIVLEFKSEKHTINFTDDEFVKEYTKFVVLPKDAAGMDFELTVYAEDETGKITEKKVKFATKKTEQGKKIEAPVFEVG